MTGLKKNLALPVSERRALIEPINLRISISRQAELLGIARSTIYYSTTVDPKNLEMMRLIDEQYTKTPFYGSRKMTVVLNQFGYSVNRKRVQRLMRKMGIEAIYPKPKLSLTNKQHLKYPYLLENVAIENKNQVWAADITYIRMAYGFVYLMAIMDWFSRFVVAWELSTSLEADFCVRALETALKQGFPMIFNTDQGSQFTSADFLDVLRDRRIQISMDGRGRVFDNIFTERLWRSLKYEEVYIKDYQTVKDAREGIEQYFDFYNNERPHQALS